MSLESTRLHAAPRRAFPFLVLLASAAAACAGGTGSSDQAAGSAGGTSGPTQAPGASAVQAGLVPDCCVLVDHPPGGGYESLRFVLDPHAGGLAPEIRVTGLFWGRKVDVYDRDAQGSRHRIHKDFVISDAIVSDGQSFLLATHPVTQVQELTILHPADSPEFLSAFTDGGALPRIDADLAPILDAGLSGAGPFTMVPRNATIVVRLDDLLDEDLVSAANVHLFTGVPQLVPFEAVIEIDQNHGGLVAVPGSPVPVFHSTRVLVDATVSELEALASDPPLPVNPLGLPASLSATVSNVALRIPTLTDPPSGQTTLLANLAGSGLATSGNGTVDFGSPTVDVFRAMRSGGDSDVTGDPYDGFLRDDEPPRVLGSFPAVIVQAPIVNPAGGPEDFLLPQLDFAAPGCAQAAEVGDAIRQPGIFAVVTAASGAPVAGSLAGVAVRLVAWPPAWDQAGMNGPLEWLVAGAGPAFFASPWDPGLDAGREGCFLAITPLPTGFPASPTQGLATTSTIGVGFSEPMAGISAADGLTITRSLPPASGPHPTDQFVVGTVQAGFTHSQFTFVPALPLAHSGPGGPFGPVAERYYVTMGTGAFAPTDLAGNALGASLPRVTLGLEPSQPTEDNGGRFVRFSAFDEDPPFGGPTGPLPEWTGQHLYDLDRELVRPRPVVHFSAAIDDSQLLPSLMAGLPFGVQVPLTPLGAKAQSLWRYADAGLELTDLASTNLDLEGLAWSPTGGQVVFDAYAEFEIRLSHGAKLPDEYIDPFVLFPAYPQSGLVATYADNTFERVQAPPAIVHPRHLGYVVSPGDLYTTAGGTPLVPYPWNRTLPPAEHTYYTWRDTAILGRGAADGAGADLHQLAWQLGQLPHAPLYGTGEVPSVGLPLLVEFRTYPDASAIGLNAFDVSLAVSSSSRPFFRAFSAGGVNQSGMLVTVDPDLETQANGGFDPGSLPPGAPTPGTDNTFYTGAMDLVVRVSRSYSVWYEAAGLSGAPLAAPSLAAPVLEPAPEEQPAGTAIEVAFRGATAVANVDARSDAATLDAYGDHYDDGAPPLDHDSDQANLGIAFLNGDARWFAAPTAIDGAQYHQVRITFLSDPVSGLSPELSALGLVWSH